MEFLEKHCKLCGKTIACRMEEQYNPRWNRIQYCADCAAAKRRRDKADWQRKNRHDCRVTNKLLQTESMEAQKYIAALEEALALRERENAQLRQTLLLASSRTVHKRPTPRGVGRLEG